MGRWLKEFRKKARKFADQFADQVVDKVQEQLEEHVSSVDWTQAVETLATQGTACATASRETVAICDATEEKREQMIAFAAEIQSTLSNFHDANALETIRDLTAGDKVRQAMELAKGLDEAALACVDKSTQMMESMEAGMDSLPEVVQLALEKAAGEDSDEDDEEEELLEGLERDMEDVKTCIRSIKELNLGTALKVGLEAFSQLTDTAKRSRALFTSVRDFAADVETICEAFVQKDVSSMASKSKDLLRCIGLCDSMKQIAQGAGKLLRLLIDLFSATADRISTLWGALAFAKNCMTDSVELVQQAKSHCLDARDKSTALIVKSRTIHGSLESIGELNQQSIRTVRELSQGGEIQDAIDLARNMDDVVLECSSKVETMIDRVSEGFKNIPPILTEGMDIQVVGRKEEDPEPLNVEKDVHELEESRQAMEEADIIAAIRAGKRGFAGVMEKAAICEQTLALMDTFAGDCNRTIESFLSSWDLESASTKIKEMCRLVNLGELMKQFAQQVKRLLLAIVALMKAAMTKFSQDFPNVGDAVSAVKDKLEDAVDDVKNNIKDSLKFWK